MVRIRKLGISIIVLLIMLIGSISIPMLYSSPSSAQEKEIITEEVKIESITLFADHEREVHRNDIINLGVNLFPDFSIETIKDFRFVVTKGRDLVKQDENQVMVNQDATIGGEFTVVAVANGVYSNELSFIITPIQVSSIKIENQEESIKQNSSLHLNVSFEPYNATNKNLYYSIIKGKEYAIVNQQGLIIVKDNLPSGELSITVKVESLASSTVYVEKEFNLYVPTKTLHITASNETPEVSEEITLGTDIDETATRIEQDFKVIAGEKYVKSLMGDKLTIVDNITDFNPTITIECSRDGIKAQQTFEIYIAPLAIEFDNPITSIKQGNESQFKVIPTPLNATLKNLTFSLSDYENAEITSEGLLKAKILPDKTQEYVSVIASVDGITAQVIVSILRPRVVIIADTLTPHTSSTFAQQVNITSFVDNEQSEDLEFVVVKGGEFIDGKIENGSFKIIENITDFAPEIIISAIYQSWESNQLIIHPYIVMESLTIVNTDITEVEQQRGYQFKVSVYPQNATCANDELNYSLDVGADVATISDGKLLISKTAPIGTKITIMVSGSDGVTASHQVVVKSVYATAINIDEIITQDGNIVHDGEVINAGDTLDFVISFPEPSNVSEENKNFVIEYVSGTVVECANNKVIVPSQDTISVYKPYVTLRISSMQGNTTLVKTVTFDIHIKVVEIEYEQLLLELNEGQIKKLDELVTAEAKPDNSDIRDIHFTVSGHAQLVGKEVVVENNLDRGDYIFTITMTCEDVSVSLDYKIYVKAERIELDSDNLNPMSMKTGGELVTISAQKDVRASDQMKLKVIRGANLIDGNYLDGDLIPLAFDDFGQAKFIFKIAGSDSVGIDKLLQFEAAQDEILKVVSLIVYKPIEEFNILSDYVENGVVYIKRGQRNKLSVQLSEFASEIDKWIVDLPEIDISNRTNPIITVPKNINAGTKYTATFSSNDRMNKQFKVEFVVAQIDADLLNFAGHKKSTGFTPFTTDSLGDEISKSSPQIWVGRYIDVPVTINGEALSSYGLELKKGWGMVDGNRGLIDATLANENTARFLISQNAPGNRIVELHLIIKDGNIVKEMDLALKELTTFRPLSGQPTLKTGMIVSSVTQLELDYGTLDRNANITKDNIVFLGSGLSGVSIDEKGVFEVKEDYASEYQTIILATSYKKGNDIIYTQSYNEKGVDYPVSGDSITLQVKIHRITLDNTGGTGGTSICAVDGRSKTITPPTRAAYVFNGYFTSKEGGTPYYNDKGELQVNHSDYASINTIYAHWTEIQYRVTVYAKCNKGSSCSSNSSGTSLPPTLLMIGVNPPGSNVTPVAKAPADKITGYVSYNQSFQLSCDSWEGHKFSSWSINGTTYDTSTITVSRLTTTNNSMVSAYAYYDEDSGGGNCVADGTLVTLADGTQKPIETLDGSEMLLAWNFETGKFEPSKILMTAVHGEKEYDVLKLNFSNNVDVKVIYEHGFWDVNLNKFVYIDSNNVDEYVGHMFNWQYVDESGNLAVKNIQLLSYENTREWTNAWSPITQNNLSVYLNGLLSVSAETEGLVDIFKVVDMKYDEEEMKSDIQRYGLLDYAVLSDYVSKEVFDGFNGKYLQVAMAKGFISQERIIWLIQTYQEFFPKFEGGE